MREFDQAGSGVIEKNEGLQQAREIGFTKRLWRRGIAEALENGFICKIERNRAGQKSIVYLLTGATRVAQILGATNVGSRPVAVAPDLLLDPDRIIYVWAAYLTTLGNKPVSRALMTKHTGIHERSQRRYEARLKIDKHENYAVTNVPADCLVGFREYGRRYAFIFLDPDTKQRVIAYRLPDRRVVRESGIEPLRRTRARRINKQLRAVSEFVVRDRAGGKIRIFHETDQSLKSALTRIRRYDIAERVYDCPNQMHLRRRFSRVHRAAIYDVVEVRND